MAGKYSLTAIPVKGDKTVKVYASPKVGEALRDIVTEMSLYDGVKLTQIIEAVYTQGKKDGARETFDRLDKGVAEMRKAISHRNPGRPRKKKK
jgi:hypothetical protein